MPASVIRAIATTFLGVAFAAACAQQSAFPPPPSASSFTLKVTSRLVVTDVSVTDRNGKPVHGLKAPSFHLFDDNKPRTLSSFEEHVDVRRSEASPVAPPLAPGVVSNRMANLPPVLNVLVIDTTNIEIEEQMYLSVQLLQLVKNLPAGQSIAIYARNGPFSVLIQEFTNDHALLATAVRRSVPKLPPNDRPYLSDLETLHQLAVYLAQLPGRKNVLWFSGGSTSFLQDIASGAIGVSEIGQSSGGSGGLANANPLGSRAVRRPAPFTTSWRRLALRSIRSMRAGFR